MWCVRLCPRIRTVVFLRWRTWQRPWPEARVKLHGLITRVKGSSLVLMVMAWMIPPSGMNAPVTMAGCLAANNAGVLLGLVLSQLTREGAPFIAPAFGTAIMNMRTMAGPAPDTWGIDAEMAHYYGLPMFGIMGSSAKVVDQQAAQQTAVTMLKATLPVSKVFPAIEPLYAESIQTPYEVSLLRSTACIMEFSKTNSACP